MSVPQSGTYSSPAPTRSIRIISADPATGRITAAYQDAVGLSYQEVIGYFWWLGGVGEAPCNISFTAISRLAETYCVVESWNGVYLVDNSMQLVGSHVSVVEEGKRFEMESLGTQVFSQ